MATDTDTGLRKRTNSISSNRGRSASPTGAPRIRLSSSSSPNLSPHDHSDKNNDAPRGLSEFNEFRFKDESPRQVSLGLLLLAGLHLFATKEIFLDSRPGASFRQGLWAVLLFLIVYCVLNTKDGVMRLPHPGVWRLLHGWNLWYCMLVAVILVVPKSDGTIIMAWLFPEADRTPAKEPTLGTDHLACEINFDNVMRQLTGIWFFAHMVGWWAKMLMLRDLATCLVYSTMFELTELTLQFLVPEFQECWWDSLIMDWLLSNLLIGMMLGQVTLRVLNMRTFQWGVANKGAMIFQFLCPQQWREYQWNPSNDPLTMLLNCFIWIIMAVGEVNSFFLISILHLPREHYFHIARQALLCLTALPAVEEWYEYTRHVRAEYTTKYTYGQEWGEYKRLYMGRKARIGHFTWLLAVTISLETMAIVKYAENVRSEPPGPEIWGPWAASTVLFSIYFCIHCRLYYHCERNSYPIWLRVLKWSSFSPLLLLCRLYAF